MNNATLTNKPADIGKLALQVEGEDFRLRHPSAA